MTKLVLADIASIDTAIATINANNALIEAAMDKAVFTSGEIPNDMEADFDMNGFYILNTANVEFSQQVYLDNGTPLVGGVSTVDYTGGGVSTSIAGGTLTVDIAGDFVYSGAFVSGSGTSMPDITEQILSWPLEQIDVGGFFDGGVDATIFTVPAGVTLVRLTAIIGFNEFTFGTGARRVSIVKDGSLPYSGTPDSYDYQLAAAPAAIPEKITMIACITGPIAVIEGTTFAVSCYQNSGGAKLAYSSSFEIEVLG